MMMDSFTHNIQPTFPSAPSPPSPHHGYMAILTTFLFPPFSSPFLIALSSITFVAISILGAAEFLGKHLLYSKFCSDGNSFNKLHFPTRIAMLLCYVPAFLVWLSSFLLFPRLTEPRILLLKSALVLHFFKRIFEIVFIHKYSNKMALADAILVSVSSVLFVTSTIYAQMVAHHLAEPHIDLKPAGLALYSKLSKEGDREYKIPKGGLFELVVCPHYLFEIIEFLGISFISQTLFSFTFTFGSAVFLTSRSSATKNWYLSKFEDFPPHLKAILPFVL